MEPKDASSAPRTQIIWRRLILIITVHIIAIRTVLLLHKLHKGTILFGMLTFYLASLGTTAGAHRLWSHRTYKARLPLRIFLALMNCAAWQFPIFQWCRDHRTHHKFTDTDADPHNSTRGLFFSHFWNIVTEKHPEVVRKGRTIDVSDLLADPVVMLQKRFFTPVSLFMCILLPTWIPHYFWGETLWYSYCVAATRFCLTLNATFSVNSFAHWKGSKPYDGGISPVDNNFVATVAMGEGFHNYHHTFPQDYATSEFGLKLNPTKAFIDVMAYFGQAYDRKTAPKSHVESRKKRAPNSMNEDDCK